MNPPGSTDSYKFTVTQIYLVKFLGYKGKQKVWNVSKICRELRVVGVK